MISQVVVIHIFVRVFFFFFFFFVRIIYVEYVLYAQRHHPGTIEFYFSNQSLLEYELYFALATTRVRSLRDTKPNIYLYILDILRHDYIKVRNIRYVYLLSLDILRHSAANQKQC